MSIKPVVFWGAVFIIFFVGFAYIITKDQKKVPNIKNYETASTDRPKIEVEKNFVDLGIIKVSDVKIQDFKFKNIGNKPLQILNLNSSCGCTTGQVIYKEKTSEEFGMHKQSGYITEIAPNEEAIMRLTYRPATMPVYGIVGREVYLTTNDPDSAKVTFSIKANVNE